MIKEFCDQKKYMLIAAVVGVISAFLPWASVKAGGFSISANGLDGGDGYITIILFAAAGYLTFRNEKSEELSGNNLYMVIGGFGLAGLLGLYDLIEADSAMPAGNAYASVSIGIGLYLTVLAGLAGAVIPFVLKNKKNNE